MVVRIGRALYWAGVLVAFLIALMVVFSGAKLEDVLTALAVAALIAGAGRGARYVLANE